MGLFVCSYYYITITSVWIGVKACRALCFPLKVGRSVMACFRLSRVGYDTEVIYVTELVTEPILLYFFFYLVLT